MTAYPHMHQNYDFGVGGNNQRTSQWYKSFHAVELPEFSRSALETLRQPLEDRQITISRAKYTVTLPCSFMLVASMNSCPCGYYNHPTHECKCMPGQIQRYMNKISGPLRRHPARPHL